MTTRTRQRSTPTPVIEHEQAPSNVVPLWPGLQIAPTKAADLQTTTTSKKSRKASADRGLQVPVSAFQEIP